MNETGFGISFFGISKVSTLKPGFCVLISSTCLLANGVESGVIKYPKRAMKKVKIITLNENTPSLFFLNLYQANFESEPEEIYFFFFRKNIGDQK